MDVIRKCHISCNRLICWCTKRHSFFFSVFKRLKIEQHGEKHWKKVTITLRQMMPLLHKMSRRWPTSYIVFSQGILHILILKGMLTSTTDTCLYIKYSVIYQICIRKSSKNVGYFLRSPLFHLKGIFPFHLEGHGAPLFEILEFPL